MTEQIDKRRAKDLILKGVSITDIVQQSGLTIAEVKALDTELINKGFKS